MKKSDFEGILAGLADATAIVRGDADPPTYRVHIPAEIDTKAIRAKLGGLTQSQFASRFGFTTATVRGWEQGRRVPDPAIRAYLKVIVNEPAAVERALELS
jgi:putative transcriptional regulator